MVSLPQSFIEDPTLSAMRKVLEDNQDASRRNYLGASEIGDPCARKIWYNYNNYPRKRIESPGLMAIEDGHRTEDLTAARLRMVGGIHLVTHNSDGSQMGFSDFGGKFKGHLDGLIVGLLQAPKKWHVWENKSCGHKKFQEFKNAKNKYGEKDALENWNFIYYIQHQIYMHYYECNRGYLTVAYSGGRDYESCRTEYKRDVALQYIDRAKSIIEATQPPKKISEQSDYYMCRFCPFADICHG